MADSSWTTSCPAEAFCFAHPAEWQMQSASMIDSTAGILTGPGVELRYDYGFNADTFSHIQSATREPIIIDGFDGLLVRDEKLLALYIPDVKQVAVMNQSMALSVSIRFNAITDQDMAQNVLKSVTINHENL